MIQNIQSRWRYVWLALAGVIAGAAAGTAAATYYVAFRLGLDLQALGWHDIWFIGHRVGLKDSLPATYKVALLINTLPSVLLGIEAVGSNWRTRLTRYDESHFQRRTEVRKNGFVAPAMKAEDHIDSHFMAWRRELHTRSQKSNRVVGALLRTVAVPPDESWFLFGKLGGPKTKVRFLGARPNRFPHVLLVGPTGGGKGRGFVVPNLLTFRGSGVVLDVKGDLIEKTGLYRKDHLNNDILYFAPLDRRFKSHGFNPLIRIKALRSEDERFTALNSMVTRFLVPDDSAAGWLSAARDLFIAACLYAMEQNTPTIADALVYMEGEGNKKKNFLDYAASSKNKMVKRIFATMADVPEDTLGSYISVLRGAGLAAWSDPAIAAVTKDAEIDFSSFRRRRQTLYICIPSNDLETYAPVVRLLFGELIASLTEREPGPDEPHQVMILLDEFDQLGRMPIVLKTLKTIRSFGGRYFIATQSISGLDDLYGLPARRSIQAGAGLQIYLTPQDELTAEVLSSALGKTTVVALSESMGTIRRLDESANVNRRTEERPLLSAGELLRFPDDEAIVLARALYPIRARQIIHYEDTFFGPIEDARKQLPVPYPPSVEEVVRNSGIGLFAMTQGRIEEMVKAAAVSEAAAGVENEVPSVKCATNGGGAAATVAVPLSLAVGQTDAGATAIDGQAAESQRAAPRRRQVIKVSDVGALADAVGDVRALEAVGTATWLDPGKAKEESKAARKAAIL